MNTTFQKLNLKDQSDIVVLHAPQSFEVEIAELPGVKVVRGTKEVADIEFCLAFVTRQAEVDSIARDVAVKIRGDAILWFAYPKGTSKRFRCDFNRDTGWAVLGELGFEPVRQVAIDEDWSALRFRGVRFIKSMTRHKSRALTSEGKTKASS